MRTSTFAIRAAGIALTTLWLDGCRIRFDELDDAGGTLLDAPPTASCVDLAPTCGPAGDAPCCGTIEVPRTTYYRDYDVATDGMYPDMTNPATVSAFHLDTYEITLGRFRTFVEAGRGTRATAPADGDGAHLQIAGSGWSSAWDTQLPVDTASLIASLTCSNFPSWTATPGANEAMPLNCVDWYVAFAFCIWDGGYLPTNAEWNLAASGGDEQRAYAWSSPPGDTAIDCTFADFAGCPPGGPSRVGSRSPKGDARWGHADLSGNVWEWTRDFEGALPLPCEDCLNNISAPNHILRGGSIASTVDSLRAAHTYATQPRGDHIGVRCARP